MDHVFEKLMRYPAAVIADAVFKTGGMVRCLPSGMRPLDVESRMAGIAVHGCIRDSRAIAGIALPVFYRGLFPVGPLKLPGGRSLAELFALEEYLSKRRADPGYSFNRHLADRRRTI